MNFVTVYTTFRLWRTHVYRHIILNWLKQFARVIKNFTKRFTNHYCFQLFPCFVVRNVLSEPDSFFRCETFSFVVRLFLSPRGIFFFFFFFFLFKFFFFFFFFLQWYFFFCRQTFNFRVRLFIFPWDFLFHCEYVSSENCFIQSENFWSTKKERFDRLCRLCLVLVLWARHFYSLEEEEVKRAIRLW